MNINNFIIKNQLLDSDNNIYINEDEFLFINSDYEIVTKTEFEKYIELLDSNTLLPIQKKILEEKMTPIENKGLNLLVQKIGHEDYFIGPKLESNELKNIKTIIETPEPFLMPDNVNYIEKSYRYMQDYHVDCVYCLEKFKEGEIIIRTVCSHIIHIDCMELWLKENNHCPVCNVKFISI